MTSVCVIDGAGKEI